MKIPNPNPTVFKPLRASLFLFIVVPLVIGQVARAEAPGPANFPEQAGLMDYLDWAENHHPSVARAAGREVALRSDAAGAGALPDLRFGWGEMIVPVETRVGPQQRVFSLSQSLPWFGTLGLKSSVAEARADAAAQGIIGQRLAVRHEVRAAWYDLTYLRGEMAIIADNRELARQVEAASRSSYEAGTGSFADVLSAQIDVEKLNTRAAGLADRLKPAGVRLNLAAGLPADHALTHLRGVSLVPTAIDLPPQDVLWAMMEQNNPELGALRLEKEGRRQGVDLAGKSGLPALTLGLDYIMTGPARMEGVQDSGKDPVIARLGVSIPLWGGKSAAGKKASAGWLAVASADLSDTRQRLRTRLEAVLFGWREANRNRELYGAVLLDSGRQALEVTGARYRSGQASYVDLVTTRKTLLGIELAHLRAVVEQEQALNDLATLLGATYAQLESAGAVNDAGLTPGDNREMDGKHE